MSVFFWIHREILISDYECTCHFWREQTRTVSSCYDTSVHFCAYVNIVQVSGYLVIAVLPTVAQTVT